MSDGLCECGCGGAVPLASHNDARRGWIKGQPCRFIHGHANKGTAKVWTLENLQRQGIRTETGCLEWQGPRDERGYGRTNHAGRFFRVPRLALTLAGRDPGDMLACHHCDNPSCFELAHLFIGTNRDNILDASAKGRLATRRSRKGSEHHFAILNEETVAEIRRRHAAGELQRDIAAEFGVSKTTISLVVLGKTWRHVA